MIPSASSARTLSRALAAAGAVVVFATVLRVAGAADVRATLGALGLSLWALLPWALLLAMGRVITSPWVIAGAGVLALTMECAFRVMVFVVPQGSTSAIILVFSPVILALGALPIGGIAGLLLGRVWRTGNGAARGVATLVAVACLGLVAIGIARPDLFPTAVLFRRRMLERVGAPRVVTGADAFESVAVSNRSAWFQAADLDGQPGDELAMVENGGIDILDGVTFEKRDHLAMGGDGRLWNWYSRLVRMDGRVVIVQTGGGFSDTEVRGIDGSLVWAYRPDPALAPTSLRAGDLDGDGTLDFYASTRSGLVRLDPKGKEVWSQSSPIEAIVDVAARTPSQPGLVVGSSYEGRMYVWNELGQSLGILTSTIVGVPLAIVDFPKDRGIVEAGAALQVIALDGKMVFQHPAEEGMRIVAAASIRPGVNALPLLALVKQAPRDIGRARLLLLDDTGKAVYDEVFAKTPSIFKARAADGSETLFVSADGLRALRPRVR